MDIQALMKKELPPGLKLGQEYHVQMPSGRHERVRVTFLAQERVGITFQDGAKLWASPEYILEAMHAVEL